MMQRIEFYDDFKVFLKDYFIDRKKRLPCFSHRYFCKKAGLKSPTHFLEIIEGKRKLTSKMLGPFIKGLELTDIDGRYFTVLVNFNQSKDAVEKRQLLDALRSMKRKVKQALVSTDHFEYYSRWYNIAVRELACLIDWKDDYTLLAKSLAPPITKNAARESVEFLVKAGFLERRIDGRYYQREPAITSGPEVCSLGIRAYNGFMAGRAQKAIEEFPPAERDIQSLTVGISREGYALIKQEMQEFLARLVRIVSDDKNPTDVYNVNVHLFPVSKHPAEKRKTGV
jgi:uncharacterized protein (TIGR02147 family)